MMRNSKRTLGRRWGKLLTTALLSAAMVLTAAMPAFAVQHIDKNKGDCTITLDLKYKDASNVQQQMPDGEEIQLYQVAGVDDKNGYRFVLTETFANVADAQGIPAMDSAALNQSNRELAGKLSAAVDAARIDHVGAKTANGSAKFSGLHPGLYMLRHEAKSVNDATFNPFTCKSRGSERKACFPCRRPAHG